MTEARLKVAHENGKLGPLFHGIAKRQWADSDQLGKEGPFKRKMRHETRSVSIIPEITPANEKYTPDIIDECMKCADEDKPTTPEEYFDREIFYLYLQHRSERAVAKAIGIPRMAVHYAIKNYKQKIESLCMS